MTQPLDGVTVVAIEQAVAGPLATRSLADLGARVIKVERIDGGDLARGYDDVVEGTSAHFVWINRGKESIAVDLKSSEGRAVVRRLVDKADVFLQNLAPHAAERLGFGAAELRANHPELLCVSLTGFGIGGPMEQRKAYDLLIQAEAGLIAITGTPDEGVKTGVPIVDIATGMYAAQAILAALLRRSRTGEGATIDVSMLDAMADWMGPALYTQMHTGAQPPRMGLSSSSIVPYSSYPTIDGEVLIGVQSDSGWRALVNDVFDMPELANDSRFATNVARVQNRAACDALVAAQDKPLAHKRTRYPTRRRRCSRRTGQTTGRGPRPPTTPGARPLANRRHRTRSCCSPPPTGDVLRRRGLHGWTFPRSGSTLTRCSSSPA